MRKSSFKDTFNRFYIRMVWYIDFLDKISNVNQSILNPTEKKEILEAFVLKVYVAWEILVQDLLINCLNRDTSQYAKHKDMVLPPHLTRNVCEVLISGLGFFDIKGMGQLKKIAKDILVPIYDPFRKILKDDSDKIEEFKKIRNYIAHYSSRSKQKLFAMYKSEYSLKKFCEPGNFLSSFDKKTKQTRFRNYTKAFFNAANAMDEFLIGDSEKS